MTTESAAWSPAVLGALADAVEVDVTPIQADGTRRDTHGLVDRRRRRALPALVEGARGGVVPGCSRDRAGRDRRHGRRGSQLVTFEEVDATASVQAQISATFLTKYAADRYAGAMNEQGPLESTLRLIPRS